MNRIQRLKIWERLKHVILNKLDKLSTRWENFSIQQHTANNKLSTVLPGGNNHIIANELSKEMKYHSISRGITRSCEWIRFWESDTSQRRVICPPGHQSDMRKGPKHFLRILSSHKADDHMQFSSECSERRICCLTRQSTQVMENKKSNMESKWSVPRTNKELRIRGDTERKPSRWGQNNRVQERILSKSLS